MRRRRRRATKGRSLAKLLVFILIITAFASAAVTIDNKLFPAALTMAELSARNIINDIINESVSRIVAEKGINSSDFYVISSNEDGFVNSLAVNTVLVNEVCGRIGSDLSGALVDLERHKIKLPMGVLLGLDILANYGPEYSLTLIPMGEAVVNYETKFESAGINQINFKVWLYVDTQIQIVNPLQKSKVVVNRTIALVDTVFGGKVPDSFFNNTPVAIPANQ